MKKTDCPINSEHLSLCRRGGSSPPDLAYVIAGHGFPGTRRGDAGPYPRAQVARRWSPLLLAMALLAMGARADELDLARFKPPAGWKAGRTQTAASFTHVDEVANTYCILGVYQSTPSRGSAAMDYAAEWDAIVRNGFETGQTPKPAAARTSAGLSYLVGGAAAVQGEVRSYVKLLVFPAGDRVVSVMLSASNPDALAAREPAIRAFLDGLRIEGAAAKPIPAASPTPAAAFALTCPTPPGWRQSSGEGGVRVVERVEDLGFGLQRLSRLVFLPPVKAPDAAAQTFVTLSGPLAAQTFTATARPLPLRVRLKSGATLLYDGGEVQLRQTGATVTGLVYVVVHGGMAAAAVGVFTGYDAAIDRQVREVFDGVRITGAEGREAPLFAAKELVGRWRSSSSTLGNWVDSAGNYRGDASTAMGETFTINADGTWRSQFAAVGTGRAVRSDTSGTFLVEDDSILLRGGERPARYRVTGVGRSADGRASFLIMGVTNADVPQLTAGSTLPRAGNLYVDTPD
jgi:hypothetical protein